jgi:O-antigen ligase
MTSLSIRSGIDRPRLMTIADWLAVGVGATLPWSTSATGIFIALWILAVLPTLDRATVLRELRTAAGFLPVLLWLLAAVGMVWADASLAERLGGLGKFHRLLVIPLLLIHFRRSDHGVWVLYAFLAATMILLVVSYGLVLLPGLSWRGNNSGIGVPVKNYIFQSLNFLLCAFALLAGAYEGARQRRWLEAAGLAAVAGLFLGNIFFVATSRSALIVLPALLLFFSWRELRWKGLVAAALLTAIVGAVIWYESPYLRDKLTTSAEQLEAYRANDEVNSTALHLEFLRKSLHFVETAPVFGHGTGSIPAQFRGAINGQTGGASAAPSENPHNQIFAVAIQLGAVGVAVLLAMWGAHLLLFLRNDGLIPTIGAIVVAQNILFSPFNSHLFDYESGWLYVFGVGVVGGMVLRQRDAAAASALIPPRVS